LNLPRFHQFTSWKGIVCLLLAALLYTGCKNDALIRPGDSLDVAYRKALNTFRSGDYSQAADAFETVINIGRGTDYAESGYFFLAESYYYNEMYLLAADAYSRFINLYPNSPKQQQAAYREAMSYYELSPRYKISQKYTRTAIEKFQLFIADYPNSQKVEEVAKHISEMRGKLAHKIYHAADLYMRTDQYRDAIIYYRLIIEQYPESKWAEQALVNEIGAHVEYASKSVRYKQRDRYENAVDSYETYLQLFPNGPHRSEAESLVDEARVALSELEPVEAPSEKEQEQQRQRELDREEDLLNPNMTQQQ